MIETKEMIEMIEMRIDIQERIIKKKKFAIMKRIKMKETKEKIREKI